MQALVLTLVGLMGAGKSTVARELARRWGWSALDLDHEIERRAGRTIPQIFDNLGETEFRRLEREALDALLERERVIIATGGGAPCQPGSMAAICAAGPSVWLDGRAATLAERATAEGGRPLLAGMSAQEAADTLEQQLVARGPFYRQATLRVSVDDRSPSQIADLIEHQLGPLGGGGA